MKKVIVYDEAMNIFGLFQFKNIQISQDIKSHGLVLTRILYIAIVNTITRIILVVH